MKPLPKTAESLVVRTDFSSHSAWDRLCEDLQKPVGEFKAYLSFIDDAEYAGLSVDHLVAAIHNLRERFFVLLADGETFSHPERPLLVVDTWHEPGRAFRVVPHAVQSVENNLSIANMDFEDFSEAVDSDGVFRGF